LNWFWLFGTGLNWTYIVST